MRILQVNKFNYRRGGAEVYFLWLQKVLVDLGHEVAVFSMHHPQNEKSDWEKYFVSRVSFNEGGVWEKLRAAGRMLYSFEAARKFDRLLTDFKPDIIHCHNIYHHISPSILRVAKKRNIPVVMHLHDYKLIAPNYTLYDHGEICYAGIDKNYWDCVKKNCFYSYSHSFLAYLEMTLHHKIFHFYEQGLALAIAPSQFMHDLVVKSGWPINKITTLINPAPNVIPQNVSDNDISSASEPYLLYFGRFVPEKGVDDLLAVSKTNGFKLHLAGAGPEEAVLKTNYATEISQGQFQFLGHLSKEEIAKEIKMATVVVMPSRWLENMPFALLETLAYGQIIIASKIGGFTEIIQDGINGFLFEAGNKDKLQEKINSVFSFNREDRNNIISKALETVAKLKQSEHLAVLVNIYLKLVKNKLH